MAAITMKIGSVIAALAVVAEINADSTTLMKMKLRKTFDALVPNLRMNQSVKRLASPVLTSIEARMNDMMFSHMIGCPSWAKDCRSVSTPVNGSKMMTISAVR